MNQKGSVGILFLITIIMMLFIFARGAFVKPEVAVRALETQGYSDVNILEHKWFVVGMRGCGEEDAALFEAAAVNPVGKKVNVYVCTGWLLKGSTVRTR